MLYNYLTRGKGSNLKRLDKDLVLIPEKQRFDSGRFDILAAKVFYDCYQKNIPIGIYISTMYDDDLIIKKVKDSSDWIKNYNGKTMIVSMHDPYNIYINLINEFNTGFVSIIKHEYINKTHKFEKYSFNSSIKKENNFIKQDLLEKVISNKTAIDYALKFFEKKYSSIKIARFLFNLYTKIQK